MIRKPVFLGLFAALAAFALVSCGGGAAAFKPYADSDLGVSFEYPSNWEMKKTGEKLGVFSDKGDTFVLFSTFQNIPAEDAAKDVFATVIVNPYQGKFAIGDNLLEEPKREIADVQLKSVGADKGYKGQFKGTISDKDAIISVALFIKGTDGYQVFAACEEKDFKTAVNTIIKIMNSFKIAK